jgi:transglutaminase-like putative cysteine protease
MDTNKNIAPLLVALGIALVPHTPHLPWWVVLWCGVSWGYLLFATKYHLPQPGKIARLILTAGGVLGVLLTSGVSLDRDSSVALLWIMASIKPMEIRNYRDKIVTIFMTYFLAVSCLFFSSSLTVALYMSVSICITTAVLIHIQHPPGKLSGKLGLSAKLMLKALPLTLILFVVFPRIQGSLWGMRSATEAFSGFSDSLAPGNVTSLVRNNAIAFRVKFNNQIPASDRLYWRGLVFWRFDGRAWHLSDNILNIALPIKGDNSTEYTITLEPHNHHWLFALDLPYDSEPNTIMQSDQTLVSRWKVRRRLQYRLKSYTSYTTGPLWEWESAALQIPRNRNPEAIALAQKWRAASANSAQFVNTALNYFRNNDFSYTLNPPPLGEESIDDFLFRTRKGYCEHYASAFAFLMRAAGIPARMVAGYLGGEFNPYGQYLIVRQSDAHVWVEVWLSGKGWVRTDPTLAVAPQRVEQGLAAALPPEERSILSSFGALGPFAKYWINIRLGWDAINNQWNKWVLGYSNTRQKTLLAKFGIRANSRQGLAVAIILTTILIGLTALFCFLWISKSGRAKKDAVQKAYLSFCARLARVGLVRRPSQGPLDYADMVKAVRRDLYTGVIDIVELYIHLRYGRGGNIEDLKRLKVLVKQFDPN